MKKLMVSKAARAGEQLLRTPAPQPDESLMGYILRLVESNYYETPKWILDFAGLKMDVLLYGWRMLCDDSIDFTLFKQITGLSEEEVNEMKHEIRSGSDYELCDAQWDVPINSLRFNRPMVCSDCLRENPYCRKFWDLPVVTICPQHRSLLLDKCPSCRIPITWDRKSVSQCRCGYDWRETICPELPPEQRQAMRLLMRSCGVSESEQVTTQSSPSPFEQLSFGDL
jgi:TniQ